MFEEMEKEVVQLMLRNEPILYNQYERTGIISREFTGVGFFSYFNSAQDVSCNKGDMYISDVGGLLNESVHVGFILFIKEGKLNVLEGYTYDELWPEDIKLYKIFLE